MKLHELKPAAGAVKKKQRVGRGQASGTGKTAGRGMDGQNSRSGGGTRPGFEGGQMPLVRRLPIRGFNSYNFRTNYAIVNIDTLNRFEDGTVVTPELLLETRILNKLEDGVKILGNGELEKKLTIKANKFSKSALEKIEKAGAKAEVI